MSRNAKRILSHIICLAMLLAAALPALPALPAHAEAQAAGGAAATAAVAAAAVATGGALGAKTAAEAAQTVGPAQTLQPTHAVQATQTSELSQTAQTPVADANAAAEPVAAPSAEPTAKPAQAPVDGANAPTAPAAKPPQALGTETAPSAEADGEAAEATPEPQPEAGASSEAVPPPEAAPAPEAAPEPDPEPALEPAAEPGLIPLGWSDEAPVLAVQASRGVQISIAHPALNADGLAAGVQVFYTNDGAEPDDSGSATRKKVEPSARSGAGPSWSISAAQGGPPLPYGVYKAAVVLDGKASAVGQCSYNPAPPVAAYGSGAYKLLAEVALEAPSGVSGGKIYYETGTAGIENRAPKPGEVAGIAEPSDQSAQYAGPIAVAGAGIDTAFVVKAKLFLDSFQSDTITLWYTIDASLPTLSDVKASDSQADIDAKIAKVLDAMSIDELVNMTGGVGMSPASALNSGVAGSTYAIPRLGVPSTLLSDGPAGVRMGKSATVWMSPTGLASTWDTGAIGQVAGRVAEEAKYYAVDVMLAPALNIQRNPLGGRDFEYYSEDPVISGETAAAYTRALQAGGVGVTLKHFAANNQETARSNGETVVSERALREIYLAGFERAAREGPWTVMSSYNKINSVSAASNKWLLTDMLRDAFGFTGYVMTDWGGGRNGPDSMEAQNDMWQTSGAQAAIKLWLDDAGAGQAERDRRLALVKRNVANILRVIVKTPVFNGVYGGLAQADIAARGAGFYSDAQSPYADSRALNRRTSAEGMVLLKNDGLAGLGGEKALPLPAGSSVALVASSVARTAFGTTGGGFGASGSVAVKDLVIEGGGSAQVAWDQTKGVSLEAGLAGAGFSVPYACVDADIAAMGAAQRAAQADAAAAAADAGIMVISRTSSEGKDNAQSSFDLSDAEKAALELFGGAFGAAGKRFVVLINAGASINVQQINEYADAALVVYLPGTEGGAAIADILSGAVSPSGKLTQTFPLEYDDSPSIAMAAKGREGQTWATNPVFLDEGVYVGYRYFDTFGKEDRVAYPFGHGLSYTTF
ncbi:MAG: glycoside hydrolase family 3 C-terminal domain-containing protein, partial [Clostridiales bacterium]|nr:glycoside hydrolase family 3 C-terminal domain-containing protein [Clostridiales bacterium]